MTRQEFEAMTFEELLDWAFDNTSELTTEDTLIEYAKHSMENDNFGMVLHIIGAIYNNPYDTEYYLYDYSLGTISTPTPVVDKEDLECLIDFDELDESLNESYVEVATIECGENVYSVFGGGFNTRDALVPVEDSEGNRLRLLTGDVIEFYTWLDRKGNVIREPEELEESKSDMASNLDEKLEDKYIQALKDVVMFCYTKDDLKEQGADLSQLSDEDIARILDDGVTDEDIEKMFGHYSFVPDDFFLEEGITKYSGRAIRKKKSIKEDKKSLRISTTDKEALTYIQDYRAHKFDLEELHRYLLDLYGSYSTAVPRFAELDELSDADIERVLSR